MFGLFLVLLPTMCTLKKWDYPAPNFLSNGCRYKNQPSAEIDMLD